MAQNTNSAGDPDRVARQPGRTGASYAGKLLKIIICVIVLLLGIHLLLQYLNLVVYGEQNGFVFELSNRWDLDDEISVPTWVSQVLLLLAGGLSLIVARMESAVGRRSLWYIFGGLGVLLSLDEGASLHEFALQSLHNIYFLDTSPTLSSNAWWLVSPLILVASGLLAWHVTRLLPRRTAVLLAIGGLSAVVGATVIDAIASSITADPFFQQGILVGIEEAVELAGSAVVIYAIVDYAQTCHRQHLQRIVSACKATRSLPKHTDTIS